MKSLLDSNNGKNWSWATLNSISFKDHIPGASWELSQVQLTEKLCFQIKVKIFFVIFSSPDFNNFEPLYKWKFYLKCIHNFQFKVSLLPNIYVCSAALSFA